MRSPADLIEIELDELPKTHESWIKQMLNQNRLSRDSIWSADFAVGDETFVRRVFKQLGFPTRQPRQVNAPAESKNLVCVDILYTGIGRFIGLPQTERQGGSGSEGEIL